MANNPEAKITVKMFTDDFKKGANELKNESSTLSREFKLQQEQMRLTATETEKLEAKITYLAQRQDIARRSVEQSQQAYNESVQLFGENSRAAQDMARNLDNARIDEQRLSNEVELANRALQEQRSSSNQAEDSIDDLGNSLDDTARSAKELGDNLTDAGSKMTVGVTLPIVAAGGAAIASAIQFENASARIQTSLGTTAEEAKELEDVAKNVWKRGFGESLDEVADALIRVKQNVKGIADDAELERVTESALALAKTFDSDVNEVTRAANNLMTNFGIDSEKAFDMMSKGAQNGLNFSNEMFDNLAEYAPLWADLGFSAEEMFGILETGVKNGVYNLDYLNDVVKEFGIRILDGSKSTNEAMSYLFRSDEFDSFMANLESGGNKSKEFMEVVALAGKENAEQLIKDLKKGGKAGAEAYDYLEFQMGRAGELIDGLSDGSIKGQQAMQEIASELVAIEDPLLQSQLGVALFGTKWEDLGGDVVLAMLTAGKGLEDFEGAMQGISEVQEKTFGQRFQAIMRQAQAALEPLGMVLLDLAEDWLPRISAVLETVITWFSNLSPAIQNALVIFAGIAAAVGPVLVIFGMIANAIGSIILVVGKVTPFLSKLGPIFTAIRTALTALSGPIGWIIAAVTLLAIVIYKNWDEIKTKTIEIWGSISEFFSNLWTTITEMASNAWTNFTTFLSTLWTNIKDIASSTWGMITSAIMAIVQPFIDNVMSVFNSMKEGISTIFDGISQYFTAVWNIIKTVFLGALLLLIDLVTLNFTDLKSHAIQIFDKLKGYFGQAWEGFKKIFSGALSAIVSGAQTSWTNFKNGISTTFNAVKAFISTSWESIKTFIINTAIKMVTDTIKKFVEFKNSVSDRMKETENKIKEIWNSAKSFLTNIDLVQIGKNIIQGLINGIGSMADAVWKKVKSITDGIKNAITDALDIHSPSRVTMGYGENVGEGLEIGMGDRLINIIKTAKKLASAVTQPLDSMNLNGGQFTGAITQQQSRLANVTDAIVPPQPIYIQVVSELDGQAVANNQYQYLNGMTTSDYNIGRVVQGY